MNIRFVFLGEGTSDEGLIPHIERLCIQFGVEEVSGVAIDAHRLPPSVGHRLTARIRAVIAHKLEPDANLFIVHRDADSRDPEPRYQEIEEAIRESAVDTAFVAVIPVQETEAWLLLDAEAILAVAGKSPKGAARLVLPKPNEVENIASPKERLKSVILDASQTTGRRHSDMKRDFPIHRRQLLERLPSGGYLEALDSWCRFRDDLGQALIRLQNDAEK